MIKSLSSFRYQLICLLFAVLIIVLLLLVVPRYSSHPQGMLLPAEHIRSPSSADLMIVYAALPKDATVLGHITVQQRYITNQALVQQQMLNYAENLAAKVGANGLVLGQLRYTPPGTVAAAEMKYQLTALPIYVRGVHD